MIRGKKEDETNTRWYVTDLATASQNNRATCLVTPEVSRKAMWSHGTWNGPLGGVRESFICWFCPVSSLLGQISSNGVLKPPYTSRWCYPAPPGLHWGNQSDAVVYCFPETRQKAATASAWASGHSWALDLLWLPPWQTLQRPCQSPVRTQGP